MLDEMAERLNFVGLLGDEGLARDMMKSASSIFLLIGTYPFRFVTATFTKPAPALWVSRRL
mgnify:CR=1 FL=1